MNQQKELLDDDEPKSNSPEDLGYSSQLEEGEEILSTFPIAQANDFLDWLELKDYPRSEEVRLIGILEAFSGFTVEDMRWLCRAINHVNYAPEPAAMAAAVKARDAGLLRRSESPDSGTDRRSDADHG